MDESTQYPRKNEYTYLFFKINPILDRIFSLDTRSI